MQRCNVSVFFHCFLINYRNLAFKLEYAESTTFFKKTYGSMLSRAVSKLARLPIPARCFVGKISNSWTIRVSLVTLLFLIFVLSVLMDLFIMDKLSKLHVLKFCLTRSVMYRRKCASLRVIYSVIASSLIGWMLL